MDNKMRETLEVPFDDIKERPANWGKQSKYAEIKAYIRKLNDATDMDWSFEIIEHFEMGGEVIVHGRLTIDCITKDQFGSKILTLKSDTDILMQPGDDLKAATSDCIKKCASLFGVGLDMYEETEEEKRDTEREACAGPLNRISNAEKLMADLMKTDIAGVRKTLVAPDLDAATVENLDAYIAILEAAYLKEKKKVNETS